jgi:HK97 family phage major capsid protein
MALTLTEAAKLSNDIVLQGVIDTIVKDSPILQQLPFIDLVGNALTYNRENAVAGANWFAVGDTWVEGTPTFTQVTATLKILGGDADVDQYLATTRSNVQDLEAAVVELKAKAVRYEFEDVFLNMSRTFTKQPTTTTTPPGRGHRPPVRGSCARAV